MSKMYKIQISMSNGNQVLSTQPQSFGYALSLAASCWNDKGEWL